MEFVQYTGTNYSQIKQFAGDKVLAPYFCMGFSMLSLFTGSGLEDVQEGDYIIKEKDGSFRISTECPIMNDK